jgi:maltokinase
VSRVERLSSEQLLELIVGRRWFASKGREPESAHVSAVTHTETELELALVEVRFPEGTHETYLLALHFDGDVPRDALEHPAAVQQLAALAGVSSPCKQVRPAGVEQSNSSVVLDERFVLKLYRRLEAGPNPEVELLQALAEAGFDNVAPLVGSLEHAAEPLPAALAIVTGLVPSVGTGWELALASLVAGDPDWLPHRARRLGEVTGAMHSALAASAEPHLAPEEASAEASALLVATIDEEVERLATVAPGLVDTPLGHRVGDIRDLVQELGHTGPQGLVIRVHGDYHLGQALGSDRDDWVAIDFEGEPGRSLAERRRRTSALRDVSGMLRSFAYAADGSRLLHGVTPREGWEWSCRAAFLDGWREAVDPRLLPGSEAGFERLLALFELQKLVYELRYELGHRPDWVAIPVAGLERMLDAR